MPPTEPRAYQPPTASRPDFESQLDRIVEAFEARAAESDTCRIETFLPEISAPYFREIATELIRVEMEWRKHYGLHVELGDYLERFPWLSQDDKSREAVEQEHQRCFRSNSNSLTSIEASASESDSPFSAKRSDDNSLPWPEIGDRIFDFEIREVLGKGSFGRVYLAIQGDLAKRLVVLKFTNGVTMEPQWMARLQHSNIVPIYSVHDADPFQVICMPYFGRQVLSHTLPTAVDERQPTTLDESPSRDAKGLAASPERFELLDHPVLQSNGVQPIGSTDRRATVIANRDVSVTIERFLGITAGLAHAHRRGVLHGDLKPANILLADDGTPMLLDFSLSIGYLVGSDSFRIMGGTIPYMSPEQLLAMETGSTVTLASDVYSIGVMLFHSLCGQLPFDSTTEHSLEGLKKLRSNATNMFPSDRGT